MPPYPAEAWRKPPSDETVVDTANDDAGLPAPPKASSDAASDKRSDKSNGRSSRTGMLLPQVNQLPTRPAPPKVSARPPPHRPRVDAEALSQEISLIMRTGKETDGCEGACTLPRGVRRTIADLADCMISPMVPGPLYVAGLHVEGKLKESLATAAGLLGMDEGSSENDGGLGALEDDGTVDKLWELRLCIEMLRDMLESYDLEGPRDSLSTPEETLTSVEDTLRRVAELGVNGRAAAGEEPDEAASEGDLGSMLEALQSPAFQEGGCITRSLISSRLGISGLLEAVLGELTGWKARPSDPDRSDWKNWDRAYERLAVSAGVVPEPSEGGSSLLEDACCKELVTCPAMAIPLCSMLVPTRGPMLKEREAARPAVCGTLFGGGLSNASARSAGSTQPGSQKGASGRS